MSGLKGSLDACFIAASRLEGLLAGATDIAADRCSLMASDDVRMLHDVADDLASRISNLANQLRN